MTNGIDKSDLHIGKISSAAKPNLGEHNRRNAGFTFIEVLAVLGIIALATVGVLSLRDWATSNARIAEVKSQVATIQSGVQQWRPRNGVYTGISVSSLSSVASLPIDWADGTGINPWGGDIEVTVDSADATRYQVRFTNIRVEEEGMRLQRDFADIAEAVNYAAGTFEITFQG
ncbi:prepilin-type cleavage/methylation domain-containing protein [Aliidiomarina iranensis]|uniref:Prepilin-type cleavage/methylation domain-containing protein n=1 Tax=Aliidiomarina iranensis TaxID=1434071 RepID=A0A432VWS0_9GAMM|nr:prepilin-type N-terminal cleavage/methylation domain-containing protein [Aliidiomarina iranensis]RUO21141.1 prepilin-type cleavage/methylation domain-containing protein [Aliidiomarina iranensis]